MTAAQLQTIEEIFHAALGHGPDHIDAFLNTACAGDELLRRRVEALLTSHGGADSFIETPAAGIATRIIETGQPDLLVGQTIGHYKLSKLIGAGGMGEVYLATDITAGRKAALKLLPMRFTGDAERLRRFQQEARALVGLNHPNILTVYEIGEDHATHYIASELIEGEVLRQRLVRGQMQLSEAVDVAIQVARALAAAHETSIVHRDIKPENIMLRPDGYVKVLDFGIAKLAEQEMPMTIPTDEALLLVETNLGSILGTVCYMSPEQACGAPVDQRTDIWSLGVVLYEMITGHAPFTRETPRETMLSVIETEPPPLTSYISQIPDELQQIISKALRKDRTERYQSAQALLEALQSLRRRMELKAELGRSTSTRPWMRWTAMTAVLLALAAIVASIMMFSRNRVRSTLAAPDKSIAVLPFKNDIRDPDNAYFADGIQDEILTRLSKIADLKVISRTSTQRYKSAPENLPEVARQLGVAHILEGSVQKSGDAVRVNVQLIKAANDSHLWAETFDRKLIDIFSVETEVAKAIADQLQVKLTGLEQQIIAAKPTENPEAYDAYLRGLAYSLKAQNSPANSLGAQKHLREAVRLDPKFALAWALLSYIDSFGYIGITLQATESLREEARQGAETALTLQPNLGEGLVAKGYYYYAYLKDYPSAVRYFEQARPLLPNSSRIPECLAYVARRGGQWEQSESFFNQAERLDPRNVTQLSQHALSYMLLRRFPEALRKLDQVLNITPDDVDTLALKASIAQAEGDLPRASAILGPLHPAADNTAALETQVYQAILERRPEQMISRLTELLARPDPAMGYFNGELRFWLGWVQQVGGDHAAAQESWQQARSELERFLKEQPKNYNLMHDLALAEMGLGNKSAALSMAERAIATNPMEKDVVDGPASIEILARVAAHTGETDRAIGTLQKLLSIPYEGALPVGNAPLTPALLRLDPMFDPLRNDPRFQELCKDKQPLLSEPTQVLEKSIAVLPFENRSGDTANSYFADGIQDEILTRLSKITELKVISRTSTQHYKSAPANLREIGRQLGVAHILEGSVQKSGDAVRVNVQLINAANDSHLWADTFDRKLTDIFSVESEVAQKIAAALEVRLTGREKREISWVGTKNPQAYEAYLRGLTAGRPFDYDSWQRAVQAFEEAVRADPRFAKAWASLGWLRARMYFQDFDRTEATRVAVGKAVQTAMRLDPELTEAQMASGFYEYYVVGDYDTARRMFEQVRSRWPNNADIVATLGLIAFRQGRWTEGREYLDEAIAVSPRDSFLREEAASTRASARDFPGALGTINQALAIWPDSTNLIAIKATVYQALGELDQADALLSGLHPGAKDLAALGAICYQAMLRRDPAPAITLLRTLNDSSHSLPPLLQARYHVLLGRLEQLSGNTDETHASFTEARQILEKELERQPQNPLLASLLAQTLAGLDDRDAALRQADRGVELLPSSRDARDGPHYEAMRTRIQARFGDGNRAIPTLKHLLQTPYSAWPGSLLTLALLRLDPDFDQLRSDPRFQELCKDKQL